MQAVILCGGLATRLRPITENIPKCLLPMAGRPFLYHQFRLLKSQGFDRVVLCIGHLGEMVKDCFGQGDGYGLKLAYSQETEKLLGTAGALKKAEEYLDEEFFVINGDTYLDMDYSHAWQEYMQSGQDALMAVYDNRNGRINARNDVALDDDMLVSCYEKDSHLPELKFVNAGAIILRKSLFATLEKDKPYSLERTILPVLAHNRRMLAYPVNQCFYDVGTVEGIYTFCNYLENQPV
ncbi:nucleotidyltransferase family protein [Dehalococcoides sp. THU3]|uniref:nucleotidyltransferase family protein n=1 Tax=Dehalococcoides TaxID=61434 RepID=UPI0005B56C0A|nr:MULTISPECIES: nucleotidyltransferase family protein [Dehalococcoides]QYY58501.1 nucleotidyltransferase family protein [Dehalococcoides mccartyi]BAQ34193.1 nucleotidyl transferase domain protein [Dehalococcoides sp. UCH007]